MTIKEFLDKWIETLPLNSKCQDRKEMEHDLKSLLNNDRQD